MLRAVSFLLLGLCLVATSGCVISSLGTQSWSENYALKPGVTATSPAMVDGDLKTVGETALPEGAADAYAMSSTQEAYVTLPEPETIYRIVIYTENIRTMKIMADEGEGNWKLIKDIKAVDTSPVDVRVSTRTDKIRVRVLSTSDDGELRRSRTSRGNRNRRGSRVAPGKIAEIELYGYATGDELTQKEESQKEEETLDQLLGQ